MTFFHFSVLLMSSKMSSTERTTNDKVEEHQNNTQLVKRRKVESDAPDPLQLSHLSYDCWEIVFKFLTFKDLLNVADTNKQLNQMTRSFFEYKYANRLIRINRVGNDNNEDGIKIESDRNSYVSVSNESNTLKLLRNFGDLIEKLSIRYNKSNGIENNRIETYIGKYCSQNNSLKEIELFDCPANAFPSVTEDSFEGVDVAVLRLDFGDKNRKNNIYHFSQWFPRIQQLCIFEKSSQSYIPIH